MKNKLFSIVLFLSLFSGSGLHAIVFAAGQLVKGNQKVYFFSDVPVEQASNTLPNENLLNEVFKVRERAKLIVDRDFAVANGIDGENPFDIKICFNHETGQNSAWTQLESIINQEVASISQERVRKSTIQNKIEALNSANHAGLSKAFFDLKDALLRNLMIDAVEKCTKEHAFVCSTPVHVVVVWNKLKEEGWLAVGDESLVTFAKGFVAGLRDGRTPIDAAAAAAQPVNVAQWLANVLPSVAATSGVNAQSTEPIEQAQPISKASIGLAGIIKRFKNKQQVAIAETPGLETQPAVPVEKIAGPSNSFFTAQNIFACAAGITSLAALACVAVKNNFLGWVKRKIGPSFIAYGRGNRNFTAIEKGIEFLIL